MKYLYFIRGQIFELSPGHSLPEPISSIRYFVLDPNTDFNPFRIAFGWSP